MSTGEDPTAAPESGGDAKLGDQFKSAEAEAKPYVGTDDSDDADSRGDDAVAAGADPDDQETRGGVGGLNNETGLPGVATATGMRRG